MCGCVGVMGGGASLEEEGCPPAACAFSHRTPVRAPPPPTHTHTPTHTHIKITTTKHASV